MTNYLKPKRPVSRVAAAVFGLSILFSIISLAGCVQLPTERQSIVDQRPQISFRFSAQDAERLAMARVVLDGLDSGRVLDFVDGVASLRVRPGTHTLQVVNAGIVILDERFYIGDGVSRPFNVK